MYQLHITKSRKYIRQNYNSYKISNRLTPYKIFIQICRNTLVSNTSTEMDLLSVMIIMTDTAM